MLKKLMAKVSGGDPQDAPIVAGVQSAGIPLIPSVRHVVPFHNVGLVAFDSVLHLVAIAPLINDPLFCILPPPVVYLIGTELAAVEIPTELDRNAALIDMKFIPGLSQLVLLTSTRVMRINFGVIGAAVSAADGFTRCSLGSPAADVRLTSLRVVVGLPSLVVGRGDGCISFADLYRGGWSDATVSVPSMLSAIGLQHLIKPIRIDTDAAAASGPLTAITSFAVGTSPLIADHIGAIIETREYPNDPNSFVSIVKGFLGVVKWYLNERRISALFMLPTEVESGFASYEEVTSVAVTDGGGYVVAGTTTGRIFCWYEQGGKGAKDRIATARYLCVELGNGPVVHLSIIRSPLPQAEAVLLTCVYADGTKVAELDLSLTDKKCTTLRSRVAAPPLLDTPPQIRCFVPICANQPSPWESQLRGPVTSFLATFHSDAQLRVLTAPLPIASVKQVVFVDAPIAVTQSIGRTTPHPPLPRLQSFLAPCFAPVLASSSAAAAAAESSSAPSSALERLIGSSAASPFDVYTAHAPNDRAHLLSLAGFGIHCATACKAFPHTGILSPCRGSSAGETVVDPKADVVCRRVICAGRGVIELAAATAATAAPQGSELRLRWLVGSDDALLPPTEFFPLAPFDWAPSEVGVEFCLFRDDGCAMAAAVRTSLSNVLVFSFTARRVTNVFPNVLLPQKRVMTSIGVLHYAPQARRPVSQATAPPSPPGSAPAIEGVSSAAIVCGLNDRSVVVFDVAARSVIGCKQISSDDKKDPQRLGITRIQPVGTRDDTTATDEIAAAAFDSGVGAYAPDGELGSESASSTRRRRAFGDRATAADFSHALIAGVPSRQPFFMRSAIALQINFAARLEIGGAGSRVVVSKGCAVENTTVAVDLLCPLGRRLMTVVIAFGSSGTPVKFGARFDAAHGTNDDDVDRFGNATSGSHASELFALEPESNTGGETSSLPCGVKVAYDAQRGVVEWYVIMKSDDADDETPVFAHIQQISKACLWPSSGSPQKFGTSVAVMVGGFDIRCAPPPRLDSGVISAIVADGMLIDAVTDESVRYLKPATPPQQQQQQQRQRTAAPLHSGAIVALGVETLLWIPTSDFVAAAGSGIGPGSKVLSLPLTTPKASAQQFLMNEGRDTLAMEIVDLALVTVPARSATSTCSSRARTSNVASTHDIDDDENDEEDDDAADSGKARIPCVAVLLRSPPHILILEASSTLALVATVPLPTSTSYIGFAARWCCRQLHLMLLVESRAGAAHEGVRVEHLIVEPASDAAEFKAVAAKGEEFYNVLAGPAATTATTTTTWEGAGMRQVNLFANADVAKLGLNNGSAGAVTSKDLLAVVPAREDSGAATQKEKGFFKRLLTSSWASQLSKVESLLEPLKTESFDDFTARVIAESEVAVAAGATQRPASSSSSSPSSTATATPAALRAATGRRFTDPEIEREALLGKASAASAARDPRARNARAGLSQTKQTMNENLELLNERGEKISRLQQKMADIDAEASEFQRLCKELKEKERKSWF